MPNPLEGNPPRVRRGRRRASRSTAQGNGHFVGHVFKLNVDPYVGRLAAFRVHQGRGPDRRSGFHRRAAQGREALAPLHDPGQGSARGAGSALAGDFCAVAKIDDIQFGDVLHSSHDEDELAASLRSTLPPPMHGVAIDLAQRGQEKRLSDALHKLAVGGSEPEDRVRRQINETVLRGLGELHLRLVLERMQSEFGLDVATRPPKIAYRETVSLPPKDTIGTKSKPAAPANSVRCFCASSRCRAEPASIRQRGGRRRDSGPIHPSGRERRQQVLVGGAIAGFPLDDVRVIVYDGKHHPVDSKEDRVHQRRQARVQGCDHEGDPDHSRADRENRGDDAEPVRRRHHRTSVRNPRPHCSEPSAPGNRSKIDARGPARGARRVSATTLKSLTGGTGSFTMEFDHYATAPATLQKQLMNEFKPQPDE